MNSLLLWIGGLLVAVLGLMFAAPFMIDWNAYRGVFEEEASRVLGRDVRVGGKVNLRLLPSPYVRFEKVRISDDGAALGEPFFRAEAFTLWLSPTPLLRGAIEASEIELDRPVLRLAVDKDGRGNWQALKIAPGSMPFIPSDVVLQQVRIRDGIVSLKMPTGADTLTLSGIEGEVAASSLDGPYRFRGLVDWYGSPREIRVSTTTREADGKLRYKASVRGQGTGITYVVDGELSEVTPRARHTGTLTARLPLASILAPLAGEATSARSAGVRGTDGVDLKATFDGDLDGTKLSDVTFAFEQDGKPQLMSGDAVIGWRNGLRLETRLASRWLDLDQIAAHDGRKAPPADLMRRLIGQLSALMPTEGTSLLTIDADQVNLGGDALSGVRLALARAGGLTSIGELRATLPGGARGELRGTIGSSQSANSAARAGTASSAPTSDMTFRGEIVLRGASYKRFATWVGAEGFLPADSADAPFSIASKLRLVPDGLAITDANLELGQRQAVVTADWRWEGERRLDIEAEGRSIDLAAFAPGVLGSNGPAPELPAGGTPQSGTGSAILIRLADRVAAIERTVGSLRVKLRAAEFSDGLTTWKDVDADIGVKGGTVTIAGLKLGGGAGPRIDIQGELAGLRSKPSGVLRGWILADKPEAVARILDLLPSGAREKTERLTANAARAELGFRAVLAGVPSGPTPEQVVLAVDGTVDDARLTLDLKLDGGLALWRDAPIEMGLRITGPSTVSMLQRIAGHPLRQPAGTAAEAVAFQVQVAGPSASSLVAIARLDAGKSNAAYKGRAGVPADGSVELKGDLTLESPGATDLLALVGAPNRTQFVGTTLRGVIELERKANTTTLAARGLDVGGSRVEGRIVLSTRGERLRLDGQMAASRVSIPGLLGLALDGRPVPAPGDEEIQSQGRTSPWPNQAFALGLFEATEGQITIKSPVATLTPEMEISDTETRLAFLPGKLEIQSVTGAALGGRLTARGTIDAATPGASIALDVRLTGAQLARLVTSGEAGPAQRAATGSGEANVVLTLAGRAQTPRAAMAAAKGKGEIEIRNGRVRGVAASLVEKAAVAAIEGNEEITRSGLERILATERSRSEVVLGNRKLTIEIQDGTAKVAALEITEPAATLRNMTTIDLAGLRVDSEWQIAPRQPFTGGGQRREPLPSLSILWTGPLSGVGRSEPRMAIDALEREIAFRRVEREAEKLEELRRQHEEERARIESERQKRLELDRSNSATPAGAPVIEVPLPINPPPINPPAVQTPPLQSPAGAEPGPRVIRPPAPRSPRRDARTLDDMFNGQQP